METQTRQFKLKIREPNTGKEKQLEKSIQRFKDCVNAWIQKIYEMDEYPKRGNTHEYGYHDIKDEFPKLYSNVIQEAMNRAIEIMRNRNGSLPEYEASSMSFKAVDVRYDGENIGIPVVGKERVWIPLIVPSYFGKYRELDKGRLQVVKKDGKWYAYVSVEYPVKDEIEPNGVLGVDLGIRQIAVVSDPNGKVNEFYGSELLSRRRQLDQRWKILQKQKSGSNNKYQGLKQVSGKEERFMHNINHKVSKDIVETAKHYNYSIAVENLTGLREGKPSQTLREMLHRWAYRDLMDKIEYKAEAEGIPVEYVDPRRTSKTCSKCGGESDVGAAKQYRCDGCGVELNRDLNAARNIASRGASFCSEGQAVVSK
ncbi:transposase [Natronomonas gomsonensis]|uniref:RNA-guided endonuclease InsQ/TnpB family protein n=1 Tax=Natronomonas gomsonensis TaxID=1046043 RepID=UPI0020CA8903|nr:transposase [Natronomonas gomsonensis]MCY4730528.1 transposase [Natronomonas gomsonensis]